jgi:myo-inositol 2-dehydrogenase / D-chiro-inositol 1-dehydrogenase
MNPLNIGVIGTGLMGAAHVRFLADNVPGVAITEVYDPDTDRATKHGDAVGAVAAESAESLIGSDAVDAVVVASPDPTHADLSIACVEAGKPVMCEKPLAPSAKEAYRVVEAELRAGRTLVQLGFVRRFDPGFRALRTAVADGSLGRPRVVHAVHRNARNATSTDDATLVSGSMVHEFDTVPWLLDDPLVAVRIESPVTEGFRDPQLATLWTRGGVMATVEVFVNAGYGYEVACEVVGTEATASLTPSSPVTLRRAGSRGRYITDDLVTAFADGYRLELAAWAAAAARGTIEGPSAWNGYVAAVAAEAGIASLRGGLRESIDAGPRPELYA